ncbi:CapA family protein [Butyricicoccus pullicaecorum]|uniref:Capsule synthesis protein CapA domain-containing protein n=1 Tax=Butyricicoccus pullicaecorum TaxID=501571 RepID=A0A1Y4LUD4_9FIRM|nr:CapA family protein [Butyricicoccus pullicaecorum]OUP60255.1 hypothetical protein B5F15_03065 [Butyricicoccus pullicaecorum]
MKKRLLALALLLLLTGCGSAPSTQADASEPPEATEPVVQPNIVSTLAVCGDAMSHMPQTRDAYDSQAGAYDYKPMIRFAKPRIEQADYAVVNLETTFAGGPDYSGFPAFNTPDALGDALKDAGFDLVSTANNHCLDRGYDGMVRTLDVLDNLGLAHVGTYRSAEERAAQNGVHVADVGGIKVAFLSYTYGTNGIPVSKSHPDTVNILHTDYMSDAQVLDTARIADDLAAAEALSPDLIAVIVHWGVEYQTTQNEHQEEIADFLFDHGADVILGSHPHVLQPMETRTLTDRDGTTHTGFVCWSLGNFISSQNDEYTDTTVVLNLELTKNPNTGVTDVTKVGYVPLYMLDREQEVGGERFTLLDAHRGIEEYASGDSSYISASTEKKLQKCVSDCHKILGAEYDQAA